jgi:hypothetical protein
MKYSRTYQNILEILWVVALVSLPITSFPPVWFWIKAVVAPLSALPVLLLLVIWFVPYILRRGKLPKESVPLFIFVLLIFVISAGAILFLDAPTFKDRTIVSQEFRALVTLGIGISFYIIFSTWPVSNQRLKKTLRWINLGGLILILWALVQAYFVQVGRLHIPQWWLDFQDLFVVQSPFSIVKGGVRVSGLAYEPSWFAHQLNILYFPLWIAASYLGYSAFERRIWRISVENILLVLGVIVFFLSSPRVGILAFLLMIVFIFIKVNIAIYRRITRKVSAYTWFKEAGGERTKRVMSYLIGLGSALVIMAVYAGLVAGVFYLASQRDWRLTLLLNNPPKWNEIRGLLLLEDKAFLWAGYRFAFLERVVYWVTGFRVFNQHPWFGVGLGNVGFFFSENVPSVGLASYEIRDVLFRMASLPNTKSLWVRLLSETGLVGFSVFLSWLLVLWRSAGFSGRSNHRVMKIIALAGQLSLVALVVEGFSIDSFAMPYLWVIAGLISVTGMVFRGKFKGDVGGE